MIDIIVDTATKEELRATADDMVVKGKGILAADESSPTIKKRFWPGSNVGRYVLYSARKKLLSKIHPFVYT